jgi:hypothetical protein
MDEIEITEEAKVRLQEKHAELVRVIESFESLEKSREWETLKELIFSKSLENIERQLLNESTAPVIDTNKLYRLQGELAWAKKYNDVDRFIDSLKKQLADINKKIK